MLTGFPLKTPVVPSGGLVTGENVRVNTAPVKVSPSQAFAKLKCSAVLKDISISFGYGPKSTGGGATQSSTSSPLPHPTTAIPNATSIASPKPFFAIVCSFAAPWHGARKYINSPYEPLPRGTGTEPSRAPSTGAFWREKQVSETCPRNQTQVPSATKRTKLGLFFLGNNGRIYVCVLPETEEIVKWVASWFFRRVPNIICICPRLCQEPGEMSSGIFGGTRQEQVHSNYPANILIKSSLIKIFSLPTCLCDRKPLAASSAKYFDAVFLFTPSFLTRISILE